MHWWPPVWFLRSGMTMSTFELVISGLAALGLFAYGLQSLSREIEETGGERLKHLLSRVTESSVQGYLLGIVATALIQSSSAVSAFTVALVDAGAITLRGSFAVLLGANVGTTITAWLVSFKVAGIGAFFVVLGMAISMLSRRYALVGRSIFYFGLILFALDLVGYALKPLRDHPAVQSIVAVAASPLLGVVVGASLTAIIQASAVVVGLGVLFANQGILEPAAIVPIVVGSNLGSTATALLASLGMKANGRRAAIANTIFNALGVIVILPFLAPVSKFIVSMIADPGMAVAWSHLAFNLMVSALGFAAMSPIERIVSRVGSSDMVSAGMSTGSGG
jgi:phosphate:Na+ symporter